jgi:two-component system NarL family sensor kinase
VPVGTKLVVYRILQEALRNVEQHAMARIVRVTLRRRGSAIQLAIKDDGIGFDAPALEAGASQVGGFGLLSMDERARSVGGSVKLKSSSSRGTEILLSVPLPVPPDGDDSGATHADTPDLQ